MALSSKSLLTGSVILLGVFGISIAENSSESVDLNAEIDAVIKSPADAETQIFLLHKLQRKYANQFSPKLHNELRHLYSFSQPEECWKQCDLLLSHAVMDEYILSTLCGWELHKDPKKAIPNLLRTARGAKGCEFVKAACWLRVGDLYQQLGDTLTANLYYHKVLNQDGVISSPYLTLAERKLGLISTVEP